MIAISPVKNKEQLIRLYEQSGIEMTDTSSAVAAIFGEEILGFCLFELDEKGITVNALSPKDDIMLADGILRAALHVAAERSAMDARYGERMDEKLLDTLGFILEKSEKRLDIDKLFGGCGCKK